MIHIIRTARTVRAGFTLIEVLAVVVILGMLAVALVAGLSGKFAKARHEIAKTQIAQIVSSLESFQMTLHRYPTASEGLSVLTQGGANTAYYLEPAKLNDPWGKPYLYVTPGPDERPYEVITYGADGRDGGENENADQSSAHLGK